MKIPRHFAIALLALPASTPLMAQDRPLTWDARDVWRVGGLDSPEWAHFTLQGDIAFDGDGNLYVVDPQAGHVLKIGPDGSLLATIGRPGEGPGEFDMLVDVLVWPDGTFAANDGGRDAFHLFGADGSFQRMVRWRAETGAISLDGNAAREMRAGPRPGFIYAQGQDSRIAGMLGAIAGLLGGGTAEEGADERAIETVDLTGEVVRSEIAIEAWGPPRADTEIELGDAASMMSAGERPHFEPALRWDAARDGTVAYVDSSTYRVRMVRDGAVQSTLTRPIDPEPVTRRIEARVRDNLLRELERELEEGEALPPGFEVPAGIDMEAITKQVEEAARNRIETMEFYPEIPVIGRVRFAWDGSVWVARRDVLDNDDAQPIDVFDAAGNYIGTLPPNGLGMPNAFGPDGMVAHWEFDEMDIPSIVVRRMTAGPGR